MNMIHTIRAANDSHRFEHPYGLLLRGGGHGAYAGGFIDTLLGAGVRFDAISAAGAGTVNAVVLAFGLTGGGVHAARKALQVFWQQAGSRDGLQLGRPYEPDSAAVSSDPARIEATLRRMIDFDRIRAGEGVPLFIAASQAFSGQPRLFAKSEVDLDVTLAAMALPASARAIDGELYCAVGVHEEIAILPLSGDHRPREIIAPFLAPALRQRTDRSTTAHLWEIGRASARIWIASQAYRSRRSHIPYQDTAPLAA